jgi:cytoskeletal protein CcmA (bactofilin family)
MAFISDSENFRQTGENRTLLTIVGDSASVDGKFKISQAIEIDCELKGKLTVDGKITIQKNGNVNADVKTNEAEIIGRYEGNLEATGNVEIKETGVAVGNIKTDSLIINKGGIFSGNVARISEEKILQKKKPKAEKEKEDIDAEQDNEVEVEVEDDVSTSEDFIADFKKKNGIDYDEEENLSL